MRLSGSDSIYWTQDSGNMARPDKGYIPAVRTAGVKPAARQYPLKLGHILQEFAGAAIEVLLTTAAAQRGAHLVGNMAGEAGFLKGLEEGGVVDEALAERYGPN